MIPKIELEFGKCYICGESCNQHNFLCDYCNAQSDDAFRNYTYIDKYDITNKYYSIIDILTYTELLSNINNKINSIYTLISLAIEQYEYFHDLYLFTKLHLIKKLINQDIINHILKQKNAIKDYKMNCNHFDLMQDITTYNNNLDDKESLDNFRKNNPNDYICNDGHNVRSLSELVIDNFLYDNNIKHVYEKSIYSEEQKIYTADFYLPQIDTYIEFWGLLNNYEYKRKREEKLQLYKQLNLNIIEIFPENLKSLSDYLSIEIKKRKK